MPFLHNTLKKTQLHWTWTSDTKWMDNKFLEESFVHRPASLVHGSLPSGRARESASGPPLCRDCWLELESIGSDDRAAAGRATAAGRFHGRADSDCTSDQMHDSDAVPPVGSQGSRRESSARGGKALAAGARLWAAGNELAHASPVTSATGLALRGPVPIPCKAEWEYSQPGATGLTLRGSGADSGTLQPTRASRGPSRRTGWSSRLLLDRAMRGAARRRVPDPAVRARTRV